MEVNNCLSICEEILQRTHNAHFCLQGLQNFMYTMLKDSSPVAAKMSLVRRVSNSDPCEGHCDQILNM